MRTALRELSAFDIGVDSRDDDFATLAKTIIAREFKRTRPSTTELRVEFDVISETIEVVADDIRFTMWIGSDDDQFAFESGKGEIVCFDFPPDWLDLAGDTV